MHNVSRWPLVAGCSKIFSHIRTLISQNQIQSNKVVGYQGVVNEMTYGSSWLTPYAHALCVTWQTNQTFDFWLMIPSHEWIVLFELFNESVELVHEAIWITLCCMSSVRVINLSRLVLFRFLFEWRKVAYWHGFCFELWWLRVLSSWLLILKWAKLRWPLKTHSFGELNVSVFDHDRLHKSKTQIYSFHQFDYLTISITHSDVEKFSFQTKFRS